jgi:cell division septation protein DedD
MAAAADCAAALRAVRGTPNDDRPELVALPRAVKAPDADDEVAAADDDEEVDDDDVEDDGTPGVMRRVAAAAAAAAAEVDAVEVEFKTLNPAVPPCGG